jgi:hypothetical protein
MDIYEQCKDSLFIKVAVAFSRILTVSTSICTITALVRQARTVNGRRSPLHGEGWGFESLRAYQISQEFKFVTADLNWLIENAES